MVQVMALITRFLESLRSDERGQGLAEYALILALIAIVAIIALIFLGTQVSGILSTVGRRSSGPPRSDPASAREASVDTVGMAVYGSAPTPSRGRGISSGMGISEERR
jgi:pilus assembly protein Flp/PilA